MTTGAASVSPLIVTHSLTMGGAERFAATLASRLERPRFVPELFVASDGLGYSVAADVPVVTHGYRGLRDLWRVRRQLRKRLAAAPRPSVVVSNVLSTSCLVGVARGREGVPWVARIGLAPERGDRGVQGFLARRVYPWATALVSNSQEMAEAVTRHYPATIGRVRHLPNPTDFARLDVAAGEGLPAGARRLEGESVLLAIGRLEDQKRFDLALRVLARLQRERSVRLWVAGRGLREQRLRALADELGVADAVDWLGFCENPFPLMRAADLFLLTSDYEGLPNALIEAQGLGLPAVATRCPYGPAEIVDDGESGFLVPIGDVDAMVAAVDRVLGDAVGASPRGEWWQGASNRARTQTRARFAVERVIPRWESLLVQVTEGGG